MSEKANDASILLEAIGCLSDGLTIYDTDGSPIVSNPVSRRRFPQYFQAFEEGARTHFEAQYRSIRQTVPDLSDEEVEALARRNTEYAATGATYEVIGADRRRVQITYRPMSDGRRVAISVDVTELRQREIELKEAQQQAVDASKAKSAFLANMSHEIRTPLNGILGMAQVLETSALTEEQKDQVSTILDSGRNLLALLNDVLDLSKIEAGKIAIVNADTDVSHTLRRIYRLWKAKAEEKGLELSLSLDADLPGSLNFDAVRVRQCVSNLISNAIKFTHKGRVEVSVSSKPLPQGGHLVKVRVSDTGVGMDEATVSKLFQPFVQADDSTERKFGGTGLGLSITRKLAELMNGEAFATSELGRGSVFTFTFAAGEAQTRQVVATGEQKQVDDAGARSTLKNQNLRVLLVDDLPINRQVAALFLKPFNMRIVEAVNGVEALAALAAETFDVVLLDMHMPVMDGPTTIKAIRGSPMDWSATPVIALTADAMSGDRERYLEMGVDGYLSKPLAERDLIAEMARVRSLRQSIASGSKQADEAA